MIPSIYFLKLIAHRVNDFGILPNVSSIEEMYEALLRLREANDNKKIRLVIGNGFEWNNTPEGVVWWNSCYEHFGGFGSRMKRVIENFDEADLIEHMLR